MKAITHKIVLVVQDLEVKGGQKIAIVSGDVHYHKSLADKERFEQIQVDLKEEKDEEKKNELQNELLTLKHVASFQMTLDSNKDFQRHINALVMEAIGLKEKE
jgi:hypothetical protein